MTALGWIFLLTSVTVVWVVTLWCFAKVLSVKGDPPDAAKRFHGA